jgi:hypothetical protein
VAFQPPSIVALMNRNATYETENMGSVPSFLFFDAGEIECQRNEVQIEAQARVQYLLF